MTQEQLELLRDYVITEAQLQVEMLDNSVTSVDSSGAAKAFEALVASFSENQK